MTRSICTDGRENGAVDIVSGEADEGEGGKVAHQCNLARERLPFHFSSRRQHHTGIHLPPLPFHHLPRITQLAHPTKYCRYYSTVLCGAHRDPRHQVSVQEACERSGVSLGFSRHPRNGYGVIRTVQECVRACVRARVTGMHMAGTPRAGVMCITSRVLSPPLHRLQVLLSNNSRVPIPVGISIPCPFRGGCICMALMHLLVCAPSCLLIHPDGHLSHHPAHSFIVNLSRVSHGKNLRANIL